jgi:catechol 2,3-dioxygenase-like lactoylglutathione lyase family enzyme
VSVTDLAIPQLPSRSLERTLAFYRRLGFEGEIVAPTYAIAERGSLELHFFLHPTLIPAESSFGCYLRVQDVAALFEAFSAAGLPDSGIPRITPLVDQPWGMREFALIDEEGSLLRIGQER